MHQAISILLMLQIIVYGWWRRALVSSGLENSADVANPPSPLYPYDPVPATVLMTPFPDHKDISHILDTTDITQTYTICTYSTHCIARSLIYSMRWCDDVMTTVSCGIACDNVASYPIIILRSYRDSDNDNDKGNVWDNYNRDPIWRSDLILWNTVSNA